LSDNKHIDVLVLDGHTRSALAVVRSLGSNGLRVAVASDGRYPLAEKSRFCYRAFVLPDPNTSKEQFGIQLLSLLAKTLPTILLPLTNVSLELCLSLKDKLPKSALLPFPDLKEVNAVNDKQALLTKAKAIGINVPGSLAVRTSSKLSDEELQKISDFTFPAVLKTQRSDTPNKTGYSREPVRYFNSATEVINYLDTAAKNVDYLLQQKISGEGIGIFMLLHEGQLVAQFCHKRILEKPPSGGVSVLSESIAADNLPIAQTLELLRSYNWSGVAMAEFKRTSTGNCYLIEVNPRFWGSLQLAIDSGINFPLRLCNLFLNGVTTSEQISSYTIGQKLRWELGTLDHFFISAKHNFFRTIRNVLFNNSLQVFKGRTRSEVFRFSDPQPFIAELFNYFKQIFR